MRHAKSSRVPAARDRLDVKLQTARRPSRKSYGVRLRFSSSWKHRGIYKPPLRQPKCHRRLHAPQPVRDASPQPDRTRLRKILRRTTDLRDHMPKEKNLRQHLIVENEIVRI